LVLCLAGCAPERQTQLKPNENTIILLGRVVPFEEAEVVSPVSSIVNRILVEPGHQVKQGQLLIRLDETGARADVARAQAELASARAALAEARAGSPEAQKAEAQAEVERLRQELLLQQNQTSVQAFKFDHEQARIILDNARAKLERLYRLSAERLVSRPELEAGQNEYADALRRYEATREVVEQRTATGDSSAKIAAARYQAAQARLAGIEASAGSGRLEMAASQVRRAEAELERARHNAGQTVLTAPISGIVTQVMAQVGNKTYEGRAVVKIENIARVKVQADLSPGLLPFVRLGQKAQVTVNTVPPSKVDSNVSQIQPVADAKTQSLGLALILANPGFKFQPGFTARVEIQVDRKPTGGQTDKQA
jgi:membrane fusion protein (multidrug efflux system)